MTRLTLLILALISLSLQFFCFHVQPLRRNVRLLTRSHKSIGSSSHDDATKDKGSIAIPQHSLLPNISENNVVRNTGLLNLVAVLWGSQHLIIKNAVNSYPSPSLVNFSRFITSLIFFIPSAYNAIKSKNMLTIKAGMELGLYSFLGFTCQAVGLQFTTASRSAFLLYLNVKFVPILAAILYGRRISANTWISAALALLGTYLLSTDNGAINVGDLWSIAAAGASAMFILRLEAFANYDNTKIQINNSDTTNSSFGGAVGTCIDPAELSGVSSLVTTVLCALWVARDVAAESCSTNTSILSVLSLWLQSLLSDPLPPLYLGFIITGLCGYIQVST
jgi:drug/metabolite transporter (DMT)-like permease